MSAGEEEKQGMRVVVTAVTAIRKEPSSKNWDSVVELVASRVFPALAALAAVVVVVVVVLVEVAVLGAEVVVVMH